MAEAFVNPYTFIPLKRRSSAKPMDDALLKRSLSGVIFCSLKTRTEIAIPDTSGKRGDSPERTREDRTFSCFRIGGKPAIPGSSIRGPIRSVYETLTNSCMSVTDSRLRSTSGMKSPGLLEKKADGYWLYPALRYRVKRRDLQNHITGEKLRFDYREGKGNASGIIEALGSGMYIGWYLKSHPFGEGPKSSHPSVFERDPQAKAVRISSECIDALEENVELYARNNEEDGISKAYRKCFRKMKDGDGQLLPVWYASDGESYQFAPSQISRSVYAKRTNDFLDTRGLLPCDSDERPCPACDLFGFVPGRGGEARARASRVRFTDAVVIGSCETKWAVLPDLMEPRTSSFEFYLRSANGGHRFTPESPGVELAGRKYYWHHQNGLENHNEEWTEFNSKIELIPANTAFGFEVFFDGVSRLELSRLIYALTIGQAWESGSSTDATYCHKIGRGKPIGLGSVLVEVDRVAIRTFENGFYCVSDDWADWKIDLNTVEGSLSNIAELKRVTNFTAIGRDAAIDYPRTAEGGDIFAWFAENRNRFARGASQEYTLLLPSVMDGDQSLLRSPKKQPSQRKGDNGQVNKRGSRRQNANTGNEKNGRINKYLKDKGYGFISFSGGKPIFFHKSDYRGKGDPVVGQAVSFVVGAGSGRHAGKSCAKNVKPER